MESSASGALRGTPDGGNITLGLSPDSLYLPHPHTEASHAQPSAEGHISTTQEASQAWPSTELCIPMSHFTAGSWSAATVILPFSGNRGLFKGSSQPPHLTDISLPDIWTQPQVGYDNLVVFTYHPSQPQHSEKLKKRADKPVGQIQFSVQLFTP